MELTWDLEVLYKGYDDPKYISDSKQIMELIKLVKEEKLDSSNAVGSIENHLKLELETSKLIKEMFSYSNFNNILKLTHNIIIIIFIMR